MSSIELVGVGKRWEAATALEDIHLRIESGTFCVLLGPSGCGKSTTLRIVAGLEAASAGRVIIDGQDVTDLPPARRGIAMVFQNYALFPHLDVRANIGFGLEVRKVPAADRDQRIHEAASLLGLTALLERKPGQLSGGQQQRVALARALVARAKVCLMDEPLSNLDAQLRQQMRSELRELQQRLGLTVVYVTHDQAEAMSMADQVVLLNKGRIEQAAPPRALYAEPQTTFAASFIGTPAMNLLRVEGGRIAGSDVPAHPQAHWLGVRPEAVGLGGSVAAKVRSVEYLGADLIARCAVGSETITLRTAGGHAIEPGQELALAWTAADAHHFDDAGRRIH